MGELFYITEAEKARFLKALNVEMARIRSEVTDVYKGFVIAVFHKLAMETPQWSGNAAANWNVGKDSIDYSVNYTLKLAAAPDRSARMGLLHEWDTPYGPAGTKGDTRAVMMAVARARPTMTSITLENKFYLSNSAKNLEHESYIQYLEENPNGFLREVNEPGHMVERTAVSAAALGDLTQSQMLALRKLKLGHIYNPGIGV